VLFVLAPDEGDGVRAVLAAERDVPGPPPADVVQAAVLLARAAAGRLGRRRLTALAAAQAERLRGLHEAGVALARSLDEGEVVQEVARQVARLVPHDGLLVAHPDVDRGTVRTALRLVGGRPRPRPELPLGAGPLALAARSGAPVRLDEYDAAREPLAAADDVVGDAGPARSVLAVPMRLGTRLVGVLAVHAAAPAAFGADDAELLRTVAAQAAVALANARAFAESEGERRQSDALVALARAVGGSRRPGEVLRLGLRHTLALLGAAGAFVALRQDEHLHVVAGAGAAELFAGALLAVDGTVPGRAAGGGAGASQPGAVIDNRVGEAGHAAFPLHDVAPVAKAVVVPLVTAEGVIGVLGAVNRAEDFGPADARVLGRLGELLAVAAVNARLFASVEEATREWRVAFDATGAGMAVLDADGRVTRANVRAAELLGAVAVATVGGAASPQALLGADFAARVCGAAGADAGALRALLGAGERRRERVRGPDAAGGGGRVFEVLVSPHPAGGVVATFDDVTAQVALAERHRLVVETSSDALLITSRAGRVVYANPAAVALFGRGEALVGARAIELMRADESARLNRRIAGRRLSEPLEYEFTAVRPDGTERLLAASTAPLRELGEAAPASGVVAALRDVTEERRAQAAARASSERYAQLVEAAADGIFTVDVGGVVTSANSALERAAGAGRGPAAERVVGRHCLELVDPRDRARAEALLAAALGGAPTRGELRFRDRRGRPRVASVSAAPVSAAPVGALGGAPGALAVVRDVTEERRTADERVQREKLAAMGQLVSGVAHELNNPLAGVLAMSELLLGEPLLADAAEDITVGAATRRELRDLTANVHREARRAARTVSRLLDFARQHAPRRAAADVNQALVDALDLRRSSLRLAGVDLSLDLDYELPPAWADAHQLQQVFLNLITNAEHALAGHAGPRRLMLRTRALARAGGAWVRAEVRDSGPGLAPGDEERVFEPFYTTKPAGAGTGLGLAVSAGIVRDHGGALRAENAPGAGAAFVVELPAAREAAAANPPSVP
jgi:two-component system NtrC family sensor kinase